MLIALQSLSSVCVCKITMEALWLLEVILKEMNLSLTFSLSHKCVTRKTVSSLLTLNALSCLLALSFLMKVKLYLELLDRMECISLDLKNIVPSGGITCLYANATTDESKLWHRRLGHVNFKNINKLVKGHLVRGLPSKVFVNDHTCVACKKGKQHKASCKAKLERTIRKPLELLHMDLFGPVSVESINKKKYCLVVTDDFSRFSWVFFLATKDETNEILYKFITGLENQLNHKVKIIRCDHGTEFKNHAMNEFCAKKGIKREFSVARTPQQNGVAKKKNRTLIEAARTMLADLLLPIPFWAEAVKTACYVLNRVLVTKPQSRTPYKLLIGSGPNWMFDLDFLTNTMNYILVSVENHVNVDAGTQEHYVAGSSKNDKEPTQEFILLPLHPHRPRISVEDVVQATEEKPSENFPKDNDVHNLEDVAKKEEQHMLAKADQALKDDLKWMIAQEIIVKAIDDATRQAFEEEKKRAAQATSINKLNTGRPSVSTDNSPLVSTANIPYASAASTPTDANIGGSSFVYLEGQIPIDASTLPNADLPIDPNMLDLEDDSNVFPNDGIFSGAYDDEDVGAEADFNNMDNTIDVSPIPTLRVHKDHPKGQILGDPKSAVQTRGKIQKASSVQQALVSYIYNQNRTNHKDHQNCLLACFLSQEEPKTISQALEDESWVEAMQEELLQFKLQKVWILVDLPFGKKAIGTKWEEGIDYDEVFAPVARIEAIRLFLAFASFMGFPVYQMDVKSAFLYGTIGEEVYVHQPPGFVDPAHPNKVYKVIKALYGLHQAPKAWYETLSSFLLENGFRRGTIDKTLFIKKNKSDIIFQMSSMGELTFFLGLQVKQQPDGIFISQDKYVADILKKFDFCSIKTATTPIESNKPLVKDEDGVDVDVHVYRSMIGSLMYLTASRPDIMFAVCACVRDSPFELEAFSDSDYRGASLDRKSTTGGCQFLGKRLISWQCKKQTIMANSTTEAEYVTAANYFKNPVYHSRTKHIEIRHHFIRDCYEKRLIDVIKIHTDANVADLLTKGFDVTRFNFLVLELILIRTSMNLRMDGSCAGSLSHIWSMANLRYSNKHNMVAFLKKPTESVGFTEIVDFLKGTSLRYALTHNPTIYDSLVKQFWQTATVRTLANGIQELVASIDNKEYTITEASTRSQLQLADATGIINLSNAEIYEGLATLGGFVRENVPLLPAMLAGAAPDQADEATTTGMGVETEGATTTTTGLDAGLDNVNIHESPLRSHEAPLLKVDTSESAEDKLNLKELMDIVPKLVLRIDNLEKELQQIKSAYGKAVLTLVKRVKLFEAALKRKSMKVILSESENEEREDQGRKIQDIDGDPLVSLVRNSMEEKEADFVTPKKVSASGEAQEEDISPTTLEAAKILSKVASQNVSTYKRRARSASKDKDIGIGMDFFSATKERLNSAKIEVNTGSAGVNPVSTPNVIQTVNVIVHSPVKSQREGKAPMTSEDVQATQKTKEQIRQEEAGLAEAMRIQEEQELSEQQQKRKAEVQEAAQFYTE
ncbi:putative ribonuclease H-like domain-containing protein [Tanacetum coccineum]|uniref:Ribonuclease H-like domain-containing protein n=1 Tax=Tanacetum coccineum TaxID=301880 RepID=A0ABQ5JCL8_9ASTR